MVGKEQTCESGFYESEPSSSSSSTNDTVVSKNDTYLTPAIDEPTISNINQSSESINNFTLTDFESVCSHDSCYYVEAQSGSNSSSFSCKKNTASATDNIDDHEKSAINSHGSDKMTKSDNHRQEEELEPYINHLRNRILKLEIPTALKHFLLYNRDI